MQGKVMTVLGPIEPETLGITLTHEHLLVDLRVWCEEPEEEEQKVFVKAPVEMPTLGAIRREPFGNLDNCVLDDTALAIEELQKFKKAGGSCIPFPLPSQRSLSHGRGGVFRSGSRGGLL